MDTTYELAKIRGQELRNRATDERLAASIRGRRVAFRTLVRRISLAASPAPAPCPSC